MFVRLFYQNVSGLQNYTLSAFPVNRGLKSENSFQSLFRDTFGIKTVKPVIFYDFFVEAD